MSTTFSERIKELRNEKKLSQAGFANLICTNQSTLSAYETGDRLPPFETLITIAQQCNVSLDWLCGLSDTHSPTDSITNYADFFRTLVNLCSTSYIDSTKKVIDISYGDSISYDKTIFSIKDDANVKEFFTAWQKMYKLYQDSTIDQELYKLWLEKELSKYKDHEINAVPF